MKTVDLILQQWRIRMTRTSLRGRARILDIGTHDGKLFDLIDCSAGVGIDPFLVCEESRGKITLIKGYFPAAMPDEHPFDAVTLLAVLEHLEPEEQLTLARDCFRYLVTGGIVVITVPSPRVDQILDLLVKFRLSDAMGDIHEDHYGLEPKDLIPVFETAGFRLLVHKRFQLGLNNLMVFGKQEVAATA